MKLNQVLAVEQGAKQQSEGMTKVYQMLGKPDFLEGFSRTYSPFAETDVRYPSEGKIVQIKVEDAIVMAQESLTNWFDIAATKEYGNLKAVADVIVDGKTLLTGVPVTYLLFLEKRLTDLYTFVKKLPVLDPTVKWTENEQTGLYDSEPVRQIRNKKVPQVVTLAPATEHHPAQAQLAHVDVPEGEWTNVRFSGAISATRAKELVSRVEALQAAVKMAREQANSIEVTQVRIADTLFSYLFK